ncbi:hypothetical protein CHUAL_005110 [Chamberlinius hualienensis]
MSSYLQLCLVLLIISVNLSSTEPTACDQLKQISFSPTWFAKENYYAVHGTTWYELFRCAKVAIVDPRTVDSEFCGTAIVLRPNDKFDFEISLSEDGKVFNGTLCPTGYTALYNTVYANFTGDSNAFCVVNCNGTSYKTVVCFGASMEDKVQTDTFLQQNQIPGIEEAQNNCVRGKRCKATAAPYSSDI